jgi:hypothetical protein
MSRTKGSLAIMTEVMFVGPDDAFVKQEGRIGSGVRAMRSSLRFAQVDGPRIHSSGVASHQVKRERLRALAREPGV